MKTIIKHDKFFDRSTLYVIFVGAILGAVTAGIVLTVTLPSFLVWLAH